MKQRLNDKNYIVILGWMVTRLNLTGNELIIYAIIYGFSQAEDAEYARTQGYFREWTSLSKQAVIGILKKLLDKGLIEKREVDVNGVIFNNYKCIPLDQLGVNNIDGGLKNLTGEVKKLDQGVVKKLDPHNDIPKGISNNIHNKENIYTSESGCPNGEALESATPNTQGIDEALPHCGAMPMPNPITPLTPPSSPRKKTVGSEGFETCWAAYGRRGNKKTALDQWLKLTPEEADRVIEHIPFYKSVTMPQFTKHFERYLRDKVFLDPVWGKNGECIYDPSNNELSERVLPEEKPKQTKWQ